MDNCLKLFLNVQYQKIFKSSCWNYIEIEYYKETAFKLMLSSFSGWLNIFCLCSMEMYVNHQNLLTMK